jgi:hypothetical protein
MTTIAAPALFVLEQEQKGERKTFVFGQGEEGVAQLKTDSKKAMRRTKALKKRPTLIDQEPTLIDQEPAKELLKNSKNKILKNGITQDIQLPKEAIAAAPELTKILRDTFTPEPEPVTGDRSKSKKSSSVIEEKIKEKLKYEDINLSLPKLISYQPPAAEENESQKDKSPENPDPERPHESPKFGVTLPGVDIEYLFYVVCKFVLFDRRYINYNVYIKKD